MDTNWFIQNMAWEAGAAIAMTIVARLFKLTTGKHMKPRHEIIFWLTGCFGLTAVLTILHFGIIKPIQDRVSNRKLPSPSLHCSFVQGGIATSYDGGNPRAFYLLKVVNSGGPSIAWKWHLKITLGTGQKIETDARENAMEQVMVDATDKTKTTKFDSDEYLPNTLLQSPLTTGAGKVGWVVFDINNASDDDLQRIGNIFVLKFEDCDGNATSITNTITEKGGQLSNAP